MPGNIREQGDQTGRTRSSGGQNEKASSHSRLSAAGQAGVSAKETHIQKQTRGPREFNTCKQRVI